MASMQPLDLYNAIYKDPLTEVYNRVALSELCYHSVAIVDADSLKYVNEHCGHRGGDTYLRTLANALLCQFGEEHVFRLGGDEFAVVSFSDEDQLYSALVDLQRNAPYLTFGVGSDLDIADARLYDSKAFREKTGLRSPRDEAPPWNLDWVSAARSSNC